MTGRQQLGNPVLTRDVVHITFTASEMKGFIFPADMRGYRGMTDAPPRLALAQATKNFGPVTALADGSITLYSGEAHALLGENGAGKSTLVKILGGVYRAASGAFELDGRPAEFTGPADAVAAGVAIIYQEPSRCP